VTAQDIHEYLVERMPSFMVPRYVEFLENPERTEAMKRIRKPALRADPLNSRTWDARSGKMVSGDGSGGLDKAAAGTVKTR
jgi:carnitine-CoA ligase